MCGREGGGMDQGGSGQSGHEYLPRLSLLYKKPAADEAALTIPLEPALCIGRKARIRVHGRFPRDQH